MFKLALHLMYGRLYIFAFPFRFELYKDNFHWTEADHGTFNSVIKLTPDTAPCDLAVICRKPCIEVHVFLSSCVCALSSQNC